MLVVYWLSALCCDVCQEQKKYDSAEPAVEQADSRFVCHYISDGVAWRWGNMAMWWHGDVVAWRCGGMAMGWCGDGLAWRWGGMVMGWHGCVSVEHQTLRWECCSNTVS